MKALSLGRIEPGPTATVFIGDKMLDIKGVNN